MATVLIIDDHPLNREFLVTLLGHRGHRLLEAADGTEALTLARIELPDLIIADILMPTMDGYEFVRLLRADRSIAHIQVIFYTAYYHEQEALALAQGCGVAYILTKPSDPEVVLWTVDQALEGAPAPISPVQKEFDREYMRLMADKLSQTANTLRMVNLQQTALIEIGLQLAVERDPQRLLETFCQRARNLIGAQYAIVGILGKEMHAQHFCCVSGMDIEKTVSLGTLVLQQGKVLETLLVDRQPIRLHNPGGDPTLSGFPATYPPVQALLAAPILSPIHTYGWIALTNKLGAAEFSGNDEQLLAILAALVGRIYENGKLYRTAQHYAVTLEQEVGKHQRSEDAVRRSEQRYRQLVEAARDAIFTLDVDGTVTSLNPAFETMTGWMITEGLAQPFAQLLHPDDAASFQNLVRRVLQGVDMPLFEVRLRKKSGEYVSAECTATRQVQDEETVGLLGIARDITERRHLETQFRQAQKMEAIGRLAGGVAHDFNNLLTVIIGHADLVLDTMPPNADERDDLVEIQKTAKRAASLTHQLLAFARKQIIAPQVMNLNDLLLDMDKLLRRLIGEDIDLITRLAPGLDMVKVDPSQFEQVIANLAVNARDAMPQGGKLTIETDNVDFDETYAMVHAEIQPGHYVLLAVSDTGIGMDAQTQSHVFEPFFTTKEPGKGTGLGLATVYGIAKQNNGHISVYSEPDHGTTLKIYLPCVEELAPAPQPQQDSDTTMRGTETVLLVENEDIVRALALRVLRMYGYTVLEAHDGDAALRARSGDFWKLETARQLSHPIGAAQLSNRPLGGHYQVPLPSSAH